MIEGSTRIERRRNRRQIIVYPRTADVWKQVLWIFRVEKILEITGQSAEDKILTTARNNSHTKQGYTKTRFMDSKTVLLEEWQNRWSHGGPSKEPAPRD